jgi:hypothetical protein
MAAAITGNLFERRISGGVVMQVLSRATRRLKGRARPAVMCSCVGMENFAS